MSRFARSAAVVLALVALGAGANSAGASFPGRNGKIGYSWIGAAGFRAGPTSTSIRTVDPRTGRVRVLRDCPVVLGGIIECRLWFQPRYSPDGRQIAFPTLRIAPDPVVSWQYFPGFGTMAANGSGFEEHAVGNTYAGLAWSPAGDQLLLQRMLVAPDSSRPPDYSQPSAIFLASLEGTELSQVAPAGSSAPDWSTTGEIAFARSSDLYLVRLGGPPRRLTYRGGSSPSWSPHGTKLAFVRGADVYVIGRDGRGLRRVTRRGGDSPVWSPDGKRLAFLRSGDIYVVRSRGGGRRRVLDTPTRDSYDPRIDKVGAIDWQPLPRQQ